MKIRPIQIKLPVSIELDGVPRTSEVLANEVFALWCGLSFVEFDQKKLTGSFYNSMLTLLRRGSVDGELLAVLFYLLDSEAPQQAPASTY